MTGLAGKTQTHAMRTNTKTTRRLDATVPLRWQLGKSHPTRVLAETLARTTKSCAHDSRLVGTLYPTDRCCGMCFENENAERSLVGMMMRSARYNKVLYHLICITTTTAHTKHNARIVHIHIFITLTYKNAVTIDFKHTSYNMELDGAMYVSDFMPKHLKKVRNVFKAAQKQHVCPYICFASSSSMSRCVAFVCRAMCVINDRRISRNLKRNRYLCVRAYICLQTTAHVCLYVPLLGAKTTWA